MPLCFEGFISHNSMHPLQTHVLVHEVLYEGNMGNITITMPIDISIKPRIIENTHIGVSSYPNKMMVYNELFKEFHYVFAWSYEEIPGIDLEILVHEIPTYPGVKLVRH